MLIKGNINCESLKVEKSQVYCWSIRLLWLESIINEYGGGIV